ncbi:MAG TPA: c-type cytochrome [Rhodoblastus sp.]|nr:c-type cytochrome [Rhodoblastus sp.]
MNVFKTVAAGLAATAIACGAANAQGDAARGEQIYRSCQDCHSLDVNEVGPKHRGVFGRKAGAVPDYNYSAALRKSDVIWNEETLDQWLTNPQKLIPGAKMFFRLTKPDDRADLIEYLKERAR